MSHSERYVAHARRIDVLRRAGVGEPLGAYLAGYRAGMVRGAGEAAHDEDEARERIAAEALRDGIDDPQRAARGLGYHDGRRWDDAGRQVGLVRMAAWVTTDRNLSALARRIGLADARVLRQILAGERKLGAQLHQRLWDLVMS